MIRTLLHRLLSERHRRVIRHRLGAPDVHWSFENLRNNGFQPRAAVDVGAYRGEWTRRVARLFPDIQVLMVEPQPERAPDLERMATGSDGRFSFVPVLLGPEQSEAQPFFVNDTVSSALPEHYATEAQRVNVPMRTLDGVLKEIKFPDPNLLKLDVQGFELEVLKGGTQVLRSHALEVVQLEVSLIDINAGAPSVRDVLDVMGDHGFDLYDVTELIRRPLDQALWQMDVLFARRGGALVTSKRWQ